MYKVIIVDDEVLVRVGLKTTIDWEANGFTIVAEASDGEQGYEQFKKFSPDVVITDIKMRKKDGLWLVEKIKKENPQVKTLVLTCYDEFDFARKAIKYGVDEYILKSEVEDEELIAVMQSIKKKLDADRGTKQIKNKDITNKNDIKRAIFNDAIKSKFLFDEKLAERFNSVEFPICSTNFAFAALYIHESNRVNIDESALIQINYAVQNVVFDLLTERNINYIYSNQLKKSVFCIASSELTESDIKRMFTVAADAVKQYFDISLSVIFSDIFYDLRGASQIYSRFLDKSQVMFYKSDKGFIIESADNITFDEGNAIALKKQYNKKFIEALGDENIIETNRLIEEVESLFEKNRFNPRIVKIFYSNLIGDVFNSYGSFFENNNELKKYEYYHYQVENSDTLKNITKMLLEFIEKSINEIHNMRYNNPKAIINQAINFIQNHYDEKISLEDVAHKLNLSKHYLCSIFKKVTGENMSLYINKLRIEKAKSLLLESDSRIQEIFEEVGYSNQQYFSKVFKKVTGLTVTEYKESKINKNKNNIM